MSEERKNIEEIEQEIKYKIVTLEDEVKDSKGKEFMDATVQEITKLLNDFKAWCSENVDSEKIGDAYHKFTGEVDKLVEGGKVKINELKENEELKEKFEDGKEAVVDFGKKVIDSVEDAAQSVLDNPKVAKTLDTVSDKFNEVIHDEHIQDGLEKARKGILNVAESAYEGIKNILDKDDQTKGE